MGADEAGATRYENRGSHLSGIGPQASLLEDCARVCDRKSEEAPRTPETCEDPPMEPELDRRVAENQAILREVNEGIKRGQWPGEEDAAVSFRCECSRLGCNQLIELSMREY